VVLNEGALAEASGLPTPSLTNASEIHSLHFSMMQASPRTTSFEMR
jgi:hypothetical protein